MKRDVIIWSESGELYKAVYSRYFEIITVRKIAGNELVIKKINVSPMEWNIFKLRILK